MITEVPNKVVMIIDINNVYYVFCLQPKAGHSIEDTKAKRILFTTGRLF